MPTLFTTTLTLTTTSHNAWNILAAASQGLSRRSAGLAGETFTFRDATCPGGAAGTSCFDPPSGWVYIDPQAASLKYIIAHELGHNVARLKDGGQIPLKPALVAPDGICQAAQGPMIQKRYASLAADEGLAWYYAMVAFNQTDQTDCDFYRGNHDWDIDGAFENLAAPDDELTPSCQGTVAEGWPAFDYLQFKCGGTLEDRGTYLDWMRAFWDADTTGGLSTAKIFDLWVEADPSSWDGDGGSGCDPVDELPCDPQERLENAAARLLISTAWGNAATLNGVR